MVNDTVRNYLAFQATFPTEGGWIGDEPDQSNPAGRELIEFLLEVVSPPTPPSEIWNEESYGWAFNSERNGVTINVLVQRLSHWLVIVSEVSLVPRVLRSAKYRQAVREVCHLIQHTALADSRFSELRAFTSEDYARFERTEYGCTKGGAA